MKAKRSMRQTPSPKLKQKLTLVYAVTGIAIIILVGIGIFIYLNLGNNTDSKAARTSSGYTSQGTGKWSDASSWIKGQDNMSDTPGDNVNTGFVDIKSFITSDNSLVISGSTLMTVYDTLWVNGDLTVSSTADLVIEPNGVLIVLGTFYTGGTSITNNGGKVVTYNVDASGTSDINNNSDFYVLGDITNSNNTTFNGVKDEPANSNFGNEMQLMSSDPELYSFVHGTGTLPIKLAYFTVKMQNRQVDIAWETDMEESNDYFTIERSTDGKQFKEIATVPGAGNSSTKRSYTYTDKSPLSGTSYYRLKQTDYDKHFTYFSIQAVTNQAQDIFANVLTIETVAPNPFMNNFFMSYSLPADGSVEVRLMNMQGSIVVSETIEGFEGQNQYEFYDRNGLKNGTYLLSITHNSVTSRVVRLIKR